MLQYVATVKLADSNDHVVAGKIVTVPEIAVLKHIHGENAVLVTGRADPVTRADADERERLRRVYDNVTPDSDEQSLVDRIFGGMLTPLPSRLAQIGIDPQAQAKTLREQADRIAAAAAALDAEDPGPEADEPDDVDDMFDDEDEQAAA